MKVKTFTGTNGAAVDQQVNDWLAENHVKVRKTSTAFHRFKDHGEDAITGKATKRRAVGIAISIWYDEPEASKRVRARPATWMFG